MTMTVLTGPGKEAVAANKASRGGLGPQDSAPDDKKFINLQLLLFCLNLATKHCSSKELMGSNFILNSS